MKHSLPFLLVLASCVVAAPGPGDEPIPLTAPKRPASPMAEQLLPSLNAAPMAQLRMTPLAAPPAVMPAEALTDRQLSCTVAGHYQAVQVDSDKSWMVYVPTTGARVTAVASSRGPVNGVFNLRGDNNDDVHAMSFSMPRAVSPGDVLILVSGSAGGNDTEPWRFAPTGSAIDEAVSIHFVGFPVHRGLLHGPSIGDGPIPRFFRSFPIESAFVDLNKLPSRIPINQLPVNWDAWGSYRPTIENTLRLYGGGRFSADFFTGWGLTSSRSPWTQHQGYGTFNAGALSTAMLMLCSTLPVEEKRPLAMLMVQHGIDHLGAFTDLPRGRYTYPLGGHCWGRKFPIVFAGKMLGLDPLVWISYYLGPVFAEDTGFTAGTWWHQLAGWSAVWHFDLDFPRDMLSRHPSTWGSTTVTGDFARLVAYMGQVVPAQIGTALAAELMGLSDAFNPHLVQMVRQHLQGPGAQALNDLNAAGIGPLHWGTDYAVPVGFAVEAWKWVHNNPISQ